MGNAKERASRPTVAKRTTADERLDGDEFDLMTVRQVARGLGVGLNYTWELIRSGELPSMKIAGQVRVRRGDVRAYIDAQAEQAVNE